MLSRKEAPTNMPPIRLCSPSARSISQLNVDVGLGSTGEWDCVSSGVSTSIETDEVVPLLAEFGSPSKLDVCLHEHDPSPSYCCKFIGLLGC
mmetsp:Transcript_9196/g.14167  ORF Transcript_9196/g.14167 Transcript_9196/m.14167 type:complete len:92 (-) Transcript_9196:324-599(-)